MDSAKLRRGLSQTLESLSRAGVRSLPRPSANLLSALEPQSPAPPAEPPSSKSAPASPRESQSTRLPRSPSPPLPLSAAAPEDRQAALEIIARDVAGCTRCSELAGARTQTVFGVGNPAARVCFLGEAPGADEDRQGEPFVGRAGQLLNRIIEACTFRREDVYILNVVKCRPPGNRNPTGDEAGACREFLDRQLDVIRPEYIVCLGSVAATNLLGTTDSIGRLRGRFHDYRGAKVICTYHPAYLLRNPSARRPVWDDMKMLLADMGIEVPE